MTGMNEDNQQLITMGKVCGQVAHDMRNPLATIKIFLQHLSPDQITPELHVLRNLALSSCERLDALAEELLNWRKAGQVELAPLNFMEILREVLHRMTVAAQKAGVTLTSELCPAARGCADGQKLSRVFENLIGNAIQAVARRDHAAVSVQSCMIGPDITITIRDNGPGISEECLKLMFTMAFTTKGKCGNGLGLMYCAEVVRAHGGQISARNHPEGGAEFTVTLPLQHATPA